MVLMRHNMEWDKKGSTCRLTNRQNQEWFTRYKWQNFLADKEGSVGREEHHGDLLLSDLGSRAAKEIIPWSRKCFKKIRFCLKDEQGVQFGTGWDWQAAGWAFTVGNSYPGFVLSCLLLKQKLSCSGTCPFVHNHMLQGKLPPFPVSRVVRNGLWSF